MSSFPDTEHDLHFNTTGISISIVSAGQFLSLSLSVRAPPLWRAAREVSHRLRSNQTPFRTSINIREVIFLDENNHVFFY